MSLCLITFISSEQKEGVDSETLRKDYNNNVDKLPYHFILYNIS